MGLSKEDLVEAVTLLWNRSCEGADVDDIAAELGMSAEMIQELYAKMLDHQAEQLRGRSIEHTYIQYVINQTMNISDLTEMIGKFKDDTKQINAMVGAVRARADIWDKIVTRGQECGLIPKQADRTESILGIAVGRLTSDQLKRMVVEAMGQVGALYGKYGEVPLLDLPQPESLHYGPASSDPMNETPTGDAPKRKKKKRVDEEKPKKKKKKKKKKIRVETDD